MQCFTPYGQYLIHSENTNFDFEVKGQGQNEGS